MGGDSTALQHECGLADCLDLDGARCGRRRKMGKNRTGGGGLVTRKCLPETFGEQEREEGVWMTKKASRRYSAGGRDEKRAGRRAAVGFAGASRRWLRE